MTGSNGKVNGTPRPAQLAPMAEADTNAASHVTDHAFVPRDGVWWRPCAVCHLAEAAHQSTTLTNGPA